MAAGEPVRAQKKGAGLTVREADDAERQRVGSPRELPFAFVWNTLEQLEQMAQKRKEKKKHWPSRRRRRRGSETKPEWKNKNVTCQRTCQLRFVVVLGFRTFFLVSE